MAEFTVSMTYETHFLICYYLKCILILLLFLKKFCFLQILCPKNLIKANLAPSSDRQCAVSLNNEQEQLMPVKVVSPWTFDRGSCGNVENVLCTSQAL